MSGKLTANGGAAVPFEFFQHWGEYAHRRHHSTAQQ
jgi:hypothetical protein